MTRSRSRCSTGGSTPGLGAVVDGMATGSCGVRTPSRAMTDHLATDLAFLSEHRRLRRVEHEAAGTRGPVEALEVNGLGRRERSGGDVTGPPNRDQGTLGRRRASHKPAGRDLRMRLARGQPYLRATPASRLRHSITDAIDVWRCAPLGKRTLGRRRVCPPAEATRTRLVRREPDKPSGRPQRRAVVTHSGCQ